MQTSAKTSARICFACATAIGLLACGGGEDRSPAPEIAEPDAPVVVTMQGHYEPVLAARDALARGQVGTFAAQLGLMSTLALPSDAPASWAAFHERLRAAAERASQAEDAVAAAEGLAAVTLECGSCHLARGIDHSAGAPIAPPEGHDTAAELLWLGVTRPSDEAWRAGAEALSRDDLFTEAADARVRLMQGNAAMIGEAGLGARALPDRALLGARFQASCAACHAAAGVTLPGDG